MKDYELLNKIERIIDLNVEYIPHEGYDVDKDQLKSDIFKLIKELSKETE